MTQETDDHYFSQENLHHIVKHLNKKKYMCNMFKKNYLQAENNDNTLKNTELMILYSN